MLVLVGMNHRTASLEVRERIGFSRKDSEKYLPLLPTYEGIQEAVVLCTCNRMEIYAWVSEAKTGIESIKKFMTKTCRATDNLDSFLYTFVGSRAITHLFRVSSGLDSQVPGENEILGQVKKAYRLALEANTTDGFLKLLFHRSISVGKKVREKTGISYGRISVASIGVQLAKQALRNLRNKTILVLGAGKISELVAANLAKEGVKTVVVSNRTYEKALSLAHTLGGMAIRFDNLEEGLRKADVVISSTSAPHYIFRKSTVKKIMNGRNRPLVFIDLALPRDVEPAVGDLEGVRLHNMDGLDLVIKKNMIGRQEEAKKAEGIIKKEVEGFTRKMKKNTWNKNDILV